MIQACHGPIPLGFRVQGTRGIWMDVNKSIYIEGLSAKSDAWERPTHSWINMIIPDWAEMGQGSRKCRSWRYGFFVLQDFILNRLNNNTHTPMDVFDAAAWSSITPLSEMSIELGNQTVDMPDFTSGQWMFRVNKFE